MRRILPTIAALAIVALCATSADTGRLFGHRRAHHGGGGCGTCESGRCSAPAPVASCSDCPKCAAGKQTVIKPEWIGADGKPIKISSPRTLPEYPGITFTDANRTPRCPCSEQCKCGQVCKCHVGDPADTPPCGPGAPSGSCKCGKAEAAPAPREMTKLTEITDKLNRLSARVKDLEAENKSLRKKIAIERQ